MAQVKRVEATTAPLLMSLRSVLTIVVIGVVVGLITLAAYYLLDRYVFTPGLCSDLNEGTGRCENKLYFSSGFAMVIGAMAGLFGLVQQRVFRPLLVVLLVTVGLWNVPLLDIGSTVWLKVLIVALLFGIAYAAFSWLVQLRNFVVALVLSVVVVVLMRVILMS